MFVACGLDETLDYLRAGRGVLPACGHSRFQVDSQTVGDAIDVIEERDHLCRVADGAVRQAKIVQLVDIGLCNRVGGARQFYGVVAKCPICVT